MNIQDLLSNTALISKKSNQLLDATGGRFNIFQIIGLTTDETRLHSSFLCELLNVNGSHGLKDKPLKAFIKICLDKEFEFNVQNAISKVEYHIGEKTETSGGRIDIHIIDNENKAIIIENKIYANDQECQMLRYFNYSKKYSESRLIYLSLDGKLPSDFSLGGIPFDYIPLSYKFDIINWLIACKQLAVDFPLVREGISHYINLIKQLTNTSFMEEINDEIVGLVMQSPENMQNAFELEKALLNVKIKTQMEFWNQLKKSLENKGLKTKGDEDSKTVDYSKVRGFYEKQRNKDIQYGLWIEVFNKNGVTIHWGCEVHNNIYFGFTLEKEGKGGISNSDFAKPYRQIVKECNELYFEDSEFWLGWVYPQTMLNFRDFNTREVFGLSDKTILESVTNQIADKAFSEISFITKKLEN
ncbi:PD-(D/E)XK nuclease superfamily protein [Breznakibacter xylanolyticus]|uniref:PD-(D/E)XK nuclease superfamily protein n=1 Tax=Breznakibacter xylanolyticus TaxID=990 RepID=A0A2W7P9T3_9BACT|nr:PD-(D/E)XK nuclease family protein [Breznakibacter xylanolyticus]PZX20112.1 PD-(D/E)XK nuclease superfamily protein [Breznakibacter xylanolyticus]